MFKIFLNMNKTELNNATGHLAKQSCGIQDCETVRLWTGKRDRETVDCETGKRLHGDICTSEFAVEI